MNNRYPLDVYATFYLKSNGKNVMSVKETKHTKVYWIRNIMLRDKVIETMWQKGYSYVREESMELYGQHRYIVEFKKKNIFNKSQLYSKYLNKMEFNRKINQIFVVGFIMLLALFAFSGRAILFDKSFSMQYTLQEKINAINETYGYDLEIVGSGHEFTKYYITLERDLNNGDKEYYRGYIKESELQKIVKADEDFELTRPRIILWKN